jgi:stage V sporulation protein B
VKGLEKTKKGTRGGQNLLRGASVLGASMIIVKLFGALFKIPLGNILDGDGMGYFSTAYSIFTMIYSFSTAGLPAAIAKMVSEQSVRGRARDIRKLHELSVKLFLIMGIAGTLVILLLSRVYVNLVGTPNAWYCVLAIAPSVFFGCMTSAYRGYYEGLRNMTPTAVSQVVEVVFKLVFGLSLTYAAVKIGEAQFASGGKVFGVACKTAAEANAAIQPVASAAAILGVTVSTMIGTFYLLYKYRRIGDGIGEEELLNSPRPMRGKVLLTRLVMIAIPISIGSIVMNVAQAVDTVTIVNCLQYAFDHYPEKMQAIFGGVISAEVLAAGTAPNFIYGSYSGYALSIFNLVPAFCNIFGKSALPNVSACWSAGDKEGTRLNIESVIRMTSLIAVPASFGIFFMAEPILRFIYPSKVAEVTIAAKVLSWQGISLIFLGLTVPLFAVLQGLGHAGKPPKYMLVGMIVKFLVNLLTISIPSINVNGAALGTGSCYLIILILSLRGLRQVTGLQISFFKLTGKQLISGLLCGLSAKGVYLLLGQFTSSRLITIVAIAVAAVVYIVMLLVTKALSRDDIEMLPKGEKFAKMLAKLGLIG